MNEKPIIIDVEYFFDKEVRKALYIRGLGIYNSFIIDIISLC